MFLSIAQTPLTGLHILLHKKLCRHVLTDKNPYINKAIHVLLMHGFCTLHILILGRNKTVTRIDMNVI